MGMSEPNRGVIMEDNHAPSPLITESEAKLKQERGKLLARVYALILSPEWQENTPPPPPLKRKATRVTNETHE